MRHDTASATHLVIDISDVHDKMNIVVEIFNHYTPKDILCNIVSVESLRMRLEDEAGLILPGVPHVR